MGGADGKADRVLITGAGRGLGLALAEAFVANGDRVAVTVRDPLSAGDLHTVAAWAAGRLTVAELDVADHERIALAVQESVAALGGLDVVVNNAGVNAMSFPEGRGTLAIDTLTAEPMLGILGVNLVAPLLVVRFALPALRCSPRPRIINVSSWLGSISEAGSGNYAYASSKAALNMVTRLLANELRSEGVVSVAVNPGWMRTAMGGPRAGLDPHESAAAIVELAGRLEPFHSGAFLESDGTVHPW